MGLWSGLEAGGRRGLGKVFAATENAFMSSTTGRVEKRRVRVRVRSRVRVNFFCYILSPFSTTLQLCFADLFLRGQLYNSILSYQKLWDYNIQLECTTLHCARSGLDKNIVSATAPERAVLSELSLGVALRTDESGASEAAETCIFLASIWLAFAGHVVLFWLWLPRRGRWTAPVDSEI